MSAALPTSLATDLARYGYGLKDTEILSPQGRDSGVFVTMHRGRFQCRSAKGALLFTGHYIGSFLERFWFAEPLQAGGGL